EGDALLGARLVRSYARDFVEGSGRFAALLLPYLLEDKKSQALLERLHDTRHAARGGEPAGPSEEEPGEPAGAVHPATEDEEAADSGPAEAPHDSGPQGPASGQ